MMHVTGVVVCVDYANLLEQSLAVWKEGLNRLLVVTAGGDLDTRKLAVSHDVTYHSTEVFSSGGCKFNKAAAICEGIELLPWEHWFLLFDADIVPPSDWRRVVDRAYPKPGNLYGARRKEDSGLISETEMAGYFHLFHTSDPNVQRRPILDTNWRHAGGYDSEFQTRWKGKQVWLPMTLTHLGERGKNWWGRGNEGDLQVMLEERRRHPGGVGPSERTDGKTTGWLDGSS